jgi:alpha-mannosidase
MKRSAAIISIFVTILSMLNASEISDAPDNRPKEGWVPDKETAISLSDVITQRRFGSKFVSSQEVTNVTLEKDVWRIDYEFKIDEEYYRANPDLVRSRPIGSPMTVRISKKTGAIIRISLGE